MTLWDCKKPKRYSSHTNFELISAKLYKDTDNHKGVYAVTFLGDLPIINIFSTFFPNTDDMDLEVSKRYSRPIVCIQFQANVMKNILVMDEHWLLLFLAIYQILKNVTL